MVKEKPAPRKFPHRTVVWWGQTPLYRFGGLAKQTARGEPPHGVAVSNTSAVSAALTSSTSTQSCKILGFRVQFGQSSSLMAADRKHSRPRCLRGSSSQLFLQKFEPSTPSTVSHCNPSDVRNSYNFKHALGYYCPKVKKNRSMTIRSRV